jgi:hypothetical protein
MGNRDDNPYISIRKENYDFEYFSQPITRALLEENIIFFHKYNKIVRVEQHLYNLYLAEARRFIKSKINF